MQKKRPKSQKKQKIAIKIKKYPKKRKTCKKNVQSQQKIKKSQ